jgi:mono/diheme cytochrome c family protein
MVLGLTGREQVLVVVAAAFIVFALVASMLVPRFRPSFPGNRLGLFLFATLIMFVAMMGAVVVATGGGHHEEEAAVETEPGGTETGGGETGGGETETSTGETAPGGEQPAGDAAAGEEVFASAGCGSCHTLSAAGASGTIGPNLDEAKPSADLVVERVTNGQGAMPSFSDQLSEEQIQDVAAYVVESTSG